MTNKSELDKSRKRIFELEKKIENLDEKRIEELKLSEEKFRLLFEKSHDPILIIDGYNFVECNKATADILGLSSPEDITNIHPSKLSPEYQPDGKNSFSKAQEMMDLTYSNGYNRFEWIHLNKAGKEICTDVALTRIPYKGKDMLFTVWRDISKRKEYERDLIDSEKRFSSLFEQAADGILVGVKTGEIVEANESMVKLSGYSLKELLGKNISILFGNDELDSKPLRYDLISKGDTVIRERNIVRKDSTLLQIEMNTKILDDGRMQALFRDISKRKEAEIALKTSEEKYKSIFFSSPLGILHYDTKGVITDCNSQFVKIIGSTREQIIGLNMFLDINNQKMVRTLKKSLQKGESYFEDWYSSATAIKSTYVRSLFKAIYDTNKNVISGIGLVEDITEKKISQEKIKENQHFIEQITEQTPDIIYIYDVAKENNIYINKNFYKILGYSEQEDPEASMKLLEEIIHPDDQDLFSDYENKIHDWHKEYIKEFEYRLKDVHGNWRWFYGREKEFQRAKNKIVSIIGVVSDITERKKAEEELKERTNFLDSIIESSALSMWISDENGTALRANSACLKFFGATNDEVIGKYNLFNDVVIEKAGFMPEVKKVFEKAEIVSFMLDYDFGSVDHVVVKDATHKIINTTLTPVLDSSGKVSNVIVQSVDLTDIKKAEIELRKSEEKFRLLFENSQDAIFITNQDGFIDCNIQSVKMFGAKNKSEILTKTSAYFSPEYQSDGSKSNEKSQELINQVANGEKKIFEWLHCRMDRTPFFAEVSLIPFLIDGTKYMQSIVRDITERKQIEQRIYDAIVETEEKERQRLASDIHDEIGPLLSSLKMYIESLNNSSDFVKQDFLKTKLQSLIVESINNVREVSNALSPYLLNKYGLNTAIKSFINNTQELIAINFETNMGNDRFGIKYEIAYYRIVKELINNSIKHAKATNIDLKLNFINKELVLVYEDNGMGLDNEIINNSKVKGMGLYNIINRIKSINGRYKFYENIVNGFGFELFSEINIRK
jgi:PAS domain S-box-containing protein